RSSRCGRSAGRAAPASPRPSRQTRRPLPHVDEATYAASMPEGDAIHRAARRLQVLVGQELEVETPHPRAAVKQIAPKLDGRRLERQEREVGDALLDQRLVSGIGNIWKVESLWAQRISPWRRLADVSDDELRAVLATAHDVMRARVEGVPYRANIYRRRGHMCP